MIHEDGRWKMWFAHKGEAYRLGYAESDDGLNWDRNDERLNIKLGPDGFDSEMMEYGAVVTHGEKRFLFYNGNNYGADGIAVAELLI